MPPPPALLCSLTRGRGLWLPRRLCSTLSQSSTPFSAGMALTNLQINAQGDREGRCPYTINPLNTSLC